MSAALSAELIEQVRRWAANEAEAMLRAAWQAVQDPEADLRQLEHGVRDRSLALGGRVLEQALALTGNGYQGCSRGCACGGRQRFVNHRPRRVVTLLGELTVRRAYYHCRRCGDGAVPWDQRWDLEGTGFSPAFREALAWLSAETSFGRARTLLRQLCRVSISTQRLRELAEACGEQLEGFVPAAQAAPPEQTRAAQDFYIELDGTTLPLREGWKEVKCAALFWARPGHEDRPPQRGTTTYLGRLTDAEQFGAAVHQTVEHLQADRAARQVMVGDGAPWIWNQAELRFPDARQVVDWYHATEHLGQVGRAGFGDTAPELRPWVEISECELWDGQVDAVLGAFDRLRPRGRAAREVVRKNRDYFSQHRERMRYDQFRQQGLFIGSGVVEGGTCKHVVGRLKRAGMRWAPDGARRILNLRLCILNDQWEDFQSWRRSSPARAA
jgi:hypothetical protein